MRAGSDESSPLQLRVAEAKHRDVGKRRARMNPSHMEHLGIQPGEVVEILGKRGHSSDGMACRRGRKGNRHN